MQYTYYTLVKHLLQPVNLSDKDVLLQLYK